MKRYRYALLVTAFGMLPIIPGSLPAQAPDASKAPASADLDADAQQIYTAAETFVAAYDKGDAAAISSLFTETGEMIDRDGNVFQGRETIAAEFAAYFELSPGATMEVTVDDLRLISPGVVVEDGEAQMRTKDDLRSRSRYTITHVKQPDGKWLMASCRVLEEAPVTPHDRLEALSWLIGDWVDQDDDSTIETSTRWSEDTNYILTDFELKTRSGETLKGQQRIGWDPLTKRFKSWVHDSEGGYAEGSWSESNDEWVVKVTGVRTDGSLVTATNIYTPLNKDSFGLRSVDRNVGGETAPDFVATVVRKPVAPGQ
jgi:uncharacterized protein (TIGR02246 family)